MKVHDVLDLTHPDTVVGRHGVWLPRLQVKVPFQWGGQVQKYQHPHEAVYPLQLIGEEVAIMRALASERMAPPVGEWVYFKTVISHHLTGWWADPCGAYGYEMADAHHLEPGRFDVDRFQESRLVTGSPGAWQDLRKPGNTINGYLIDARRSGWDRLRWEGSPVAVPTYTEDVIKLKTDLVKSGQFPFGERSQPYQEYFLQDRWWPGEREVVKRATILGFQANPGDVVVDLGTCLGGFLTRAWQRAYGRGLFIGLDAQPEYVDLARRLARANGHNICFRLLDVARELQALLVWLDTLVPRTGPKVDHLLMLSMMKHFPGGEADLFQILDTIQPRVAYLETNAVKPGMDPPMLQEVERRGGALSGWSNDRNLRACYRVPGATRREHDGGQRPAAV